MAKRPLLRQASDLKAGDFGKHPVWVHCHVVDYDESWYDDTDEETFRPWLGALPINPSHAIFLVTAEFVFANGSTFEGFVTPATEPADIATMQPHVFVGEERVGFFGGVFGVPEDTRVRFHHAVGGSTGVFPVTFAAKPTLARGIVSGTVHGFYRYEGGVAILCSE